MDDSRDAWQTALICLHPLQQVARNQRAGMVATRPADIPALGTTRRTFDRIEE